MDIFGIEEDSDDEWFYDSIRRYDDLLMYDVHGEIGSPIFYDENKILFGVSRESLHELLLLSVPDKLLAGKSAGLVNDRDFNLVAATYTTASVKKIVRVGSSVVVAGGGGIYLYSVPDTNNPSDVINLTNTLKKDVNEGTVLAVSGGNVYAGDSLSNLTQLDLSSEMIHQPVGLPKAFQRNGDLSEVVCVDNKLFICLRDGSLLICDQRTRTVVQQVQMQSESCGVWTMDASKDGDFVALANSCGTVTVFDIRKTPHEVFSFNFQDVLPDRNNSKVKVQFSPSDPLLSVSGFDKNVEIFNYKKELSESKVFRHDGHRGKDVHTVVTHLWHPIQRNLLFSADDTGKLNAWRFKERSTL